MKTLFAFLAAPILPKYSRGLAVASTMTALGCVISTVSFAIFIDKNEPFVKVLTWSLFMSGPFMLLAIAALRPRASKAAWGLMIIGLVAAIPLQGFLVYFLFCFNRFPGGSNDIAAYAFGNIWALMVCMAIGPVVLGVGCDVVFWFWMLWHSPKTP